MLELKDIRKIYSTGDEKVEALKGIDLKFRESEFVSILGQSGCGKTTLLNIIGGLDAYTSGDLVINGKSTKKFKSRDWDAYRNYKVGFIFQSYNLIGHQTILSNVELALTIGGIGKKERKQRAIKALEEVGLKDHMHKKPNQLSGGQMQRVAIARALVNNPDIILADEPTGALDTKTSVQVMEILKKISKDKLIIMVTHNPELAKNYSSRIIKILDGTIVEDSNPIQDNEIIENRNHAEIGKTSMRFWTAFRLSLNNLLTKKGRTILVAFAGSIGIIGIALVQAVSNGFQAYVNSIQEEALTSYPLTIMQETTDVAGALLAMTSQESENKDNENVKEEQYISKVLANLSTNDLKSFKNNLDDNYDKIGQDIKTIKYGYSVEPQIYCKDETKKVKKLSPSDMFGQSMGVGIGISFMGSVYSQMLDDNETIKESYDILTGRLPENYNEMIIVLSEKNSISDLLVYSLGLRDIDELTNIVTKIMNGEKVEINNEAKEFTYDDLMNVDLRLILPNELYKYNSQYDVYESMSEDEEYMSDLYDKSVNLKIVGILTAKDGVTTTMLNPGVSYTGKLIDYIIENSKDTDIVKKQLENDEIDVLSGSRFDEPKKGLNLDFTDLISIDTKKLQSAFNIKIDQKDLQNKTQGYMAEISNSISTDTTPARQDFYNLLDKFSNELLQNVNSTIQENEIDKTVDDYLNNAEPKKKLTELEKKYVIPKDAFEKTYSGLLKGLLQMYIQSSNAANSAMENTSKVNENTNLDALKQDTKNSYMQGTEDISNISPEKLEELKKKMEKYSKDQNGESSITPEKAKDLQKAMEMYSNEENNKNIDVKNIVLNGYLSSAAIQQTSDTMAKAMTEAAMKKTILTKVGELTSNLTSSFASGFNVDQSKISSAFKMKMTEDEITRIVKSMLTDTKANAKTNLINFGYQKKDEPTYISFYFKSFDGKERFLDFINSYNEQVKKDGEDDKEINYTDTTGILMGSVKTIVNAVTYVLIAFISISLVVSSIMIGIITYISVYERTKEIGILRAIGASKHNISSIFNAETFIIGLLSGGIGIGVTYAVIPLINKVLHNFAGNVPLNAVFYAKNAIILVILSVILTLIGGLIPARAASKKDPVIALRTE